MCETGQVPPEPKTRRETLKYQDLLSTEAEKGTAAIKGYGSELNDEPNSKLRYKVTLWRQEECPV